MKLAASGWPSPKTVIVDGQPLLAFAGCNYLGLAHHPRVVTALRAAAERYGVASNGSRSTTGTTDAHVALEVALARFLGTAAAAVVSSGTLANFAACEALAVERPAALLDERAHSSLGQATRVAGLSPEPFAHRDVRDFAIRARRLSSVDASRSLLVLTDGVFAANGALTPVEELLAAMPAGGVLLVDDSHGLGVIGTDGRGSTPAEVGSSLVVTASLGKALGCGGGVVAGSRDVVERVSQSLSFRGGTPIAPALARAACVALEIARGDTELRCRLHDNVRALRSVFNELGLPLAAGETPIFTVVPRDQSTLEALQLAARQAGLLLPVIEYPGGPAPRYVRIAVNAAHDEVDIERLADVLRLGLQR